MLLKMLGRQIAAARNLVQMSQRELARRIGTSQNGISNIETGNVDQTYTTLLKIAEVLDTTVEHLRQPVAKFANEERATYETKPKKEPGGRRRGESDSPMRTRKAERLNRSAFLF